MEKNKNQNYPHFNIQFFKKIIIATTIYKKLLIWSIWSLLQVFLFTRLCNMIDSLPLTKVTSLESLIHYYYTWHKDAVKFMSSKKSTLLLNNLQVHLL